MSLTTKLISSLGLLSFLSAAHAGPFAYITNQGDHSVSVVDLVTRKVRATIPVA